MPDRAKVIKGLECCANGGRDLCKKCYQEGPGFGIACRQGLMQDALELLKEQEPAKAVRRVEETEWNVCSNCSSHIISKWKWCPYCGRAVKWDD